MNVQCAYALDEIFGFYRKSFPTKSLFIDWTIKLENGRETEFIYLWLLLLEDGVYI